MQSLEDKDSIVMIRWVGWIPARADQKEELRALGVEGEMRCGFDSDGQPHIEYCDCNHPTMKRVIDKFPGFWPESFTGYVVKSDKHLLRICQKYWKMHLPEWDALRETVTGPGRELTLIERIKLAWYLFRKAIGYVGPSPQISET